MDVCQLLNIYKFELKGKGSSDKKMAEHSTENQKKNWNFSSRIKKRDLMKLTVSEYQAKP